MDQKHGKRMYKSQGEGGTKGIGTEYRGTNAMGRIMKLSESTILIVKKHFLRAAHSSR